jgi:hypothetical protein
MENGIRILHRAVVGALLTATLTHAGTGQNLITNGDFELPAISPNSFEFTAPTGWSSGLLFNANGGEPIWPFPWSGQQYANFGLGLAYQLVTVTNPGNYILEWAENSATGAGGDPDARYQVTITDSRSETLASGSFNAQNQGVWEAQSLQVALQPGTYAVNFEHTAGEYDNLIDAASLTQLSVPEPEQWATLMAGALLAISAFRRGSGRKR